MMTNGIKFFDFWPPCILPLIYFTKLMIIWGRIEIHNPEKRYIIFTRYIGNSSKWKEKIYGWGAVGAAGIQFLI